MSPFKRFKKWKQLEISRTWIHPEPLAFLGSGSSTIMRIVNGIAKWTGCVGLSQLYSGPSFQTGDLQDFP
jgi:hypothetical protein